jgi:hypothetical protein
VLKGRLFAALFFLAARSGREMKTLSKKAALATEKLG